MITEVRSKVPVVVIGGSLNSLGVVRSLSAASMPVYVIETTSRCPSRWSRFCEFVLAPSLEDRPLVDTLKRLAARIGAGAVVIATDDRAVETISEYREELAPLFRLNLPSIEMVRILADKTLFQAFAEEQGLPVPRSVVLTNVADIARLDAISMPAVLKPASKSEVLNGQVERAMRVDTRAEGATVARRMLKGAESVIAQEWIEGADSEIYFTLFACAPDGELVGCFTGRKLICNPPDVGSTAFCVAAAPPEALELEKLTRRFLALTRYRGVGSLELKRDSRIGRFMIVEPTVGRTDWQEEIATMCGVNIPLLAYRAELGERSHEPPRINDRVAWRSEMSHRVPTRGLRPGTRIRDAYFRLADPVPGFYFYGYERFVARVVNRLARAGRSLSLL